MSYQSGYISVHEIRNYEKKRKWCVPDQPFWMTSAYAFVQSESKDTVLPCILYAHIGVSLFSSHGNARGRSIKESESSFHKVVAWCSLIYKQYCVTYVHK